MSRHARRRFHSVNIWPAFVDVLSTLLIIMIFALLVFMLAQAFLSRSLSVRDEAIEKLTGRAADLVEKLSLEQAENKRLRLSVATLSTQLSEATARADAGDDARRAVPVLSLQLNELQTQLALLNAALDASEQRSRDQEVTIESLGLQLNAALAEKVQELQQYRSDFFGRLRALLGEREDIRIVGDRFVFQSEVLFPSGSAELEPDGRETLRYIGDTLIALADDIPPDVAWVLRVDGHTDSRPINTAQFRSNWELSSARAISVVNFLIDYGVPPQRLAAAGFASFQPLDPGNDADAWRKNRRIELKLDQR